MESRDKIDNLEEQPYGEESLQSDADAEVDIPPDNIDSSEDLLDDHAEDMIKDLHNLLFLQGPQPQGDDVEGAVGQNVEQQQEADLDANLDDQDNLPQDYHYLRELQYNKPRQPKKGDVVKYFDFNYDRWLRVEVVSQHKKTSKYAGSINCVFMDIDREPDGLYIHFGDFWSIIQSPNDDPETVAEVVREESCSKDLVLTSL